MQEVQEYTLSQAYMMETQAQGSGLPIGWMPRPEIYVPQTIPVYPKNRYQPLIGLEKCRFPDLFGKLSACREPREQTRHNPNPAVGHDEVGDFWGAGQGAITRNSATPQGGAVPFQRGRSGLGLSSCSEEVGLTRPWYLLLGRSCVEGTLAQHFGAPTP